MVFENTGDHNWLTYCVSAKLIARRSTFYAYVPIENSLGDGRWLAWLLCSQYATSVYCDVLLSSLIN